MGRSEAPYDLESKSLVKLSNLTETAVAPKPIERQRVSTCLQIFSERTHAALLTHPSLDPSKVQDTAVFINKVICWWKIINVKAFGEDVRRQEPLQAVICNSDDERLKILLDFGKMAFDMACNHGKRDKQLSKDTAMAIYQTCNGLVDLCKSLLQSTHKYVLLGQFTSDHLEKEYSKLRQGCGGAYFLSVQQVIEKVQIRKTSVLLKSGFDTESLQTESSHVCSMCSYKLTEEASEVFDGLPELEFFISDNVKMSLVYIAGYVSRKDESLSENELLIGYTNFYYEKYGQLIKTLDRGKLKVPTDQACQWTFFCFVVFHAVKSEVCRKSLCNIFDLVSEFYEFNMNKKHCLILSNIFLRNLCIQETPKCGKEPALKILKLS